MNECEAMVIRTSVSSCFNGNNALFSSLSGAIILMFTISSVRIRQAKKRQHTRMRAQLAWPAESPGVKTPNFPGQREALIAGSQIKKKSRPHTAKALTGRRIY